MEQNIVHVWCPFCYISLESRLEASLYVKFVEQDFLVETSGFLCEKCGACLCRSQWSLAMAWCAKSKNKDNEIHYNDIQKALKFSSTKTTQIP